MAHAMLTGCLHSAPVYGTTIRSLQQLIGQFQSDENVHVKALVSRMRKLLENIQLSSGNSKLEVVRTLARPQHDVTHEAESVFWLLVFLLIRVKPLAVDFRDTETKMNLRTDVFKAMVTAKVGLHARGSIFDYNERAWKDLLPTCLAGSCAPLLGRLSDYFCVTWHGHELPVQCRQHALDFIQLALLDAMQALGPDDIELDVTHPLPVRCDVIAPLLLGSDAPKRKLGTHAAPPPKRQKRSVKAATTGVASRILRSTGLMKYSSHSVELPPQPEDQMRDKLLKFIGEVVEGKQQERLWFPQDDEAVSRHFMSV